ncbi:MAG: hypothetical protein UZ04_CHB001000856 [Chlorobi bacterium OLB4]|jgi:hypothetical protein|nr:MAG: hypothetical protein UZ04_CHB001000856 [Chlorobi bacterium OLB4]OQY78586.1 MAG: hypothetical protein B6D43_01965 [Ignavibacteriales bacterium UTCHB1]
MINLKWIFKQFRAAINHINSVNYKHNQSFLTTVVNNSKITTVSGIVKIAQVKIINKILTKCFGLFEDS